MKLMLKTLFFNENSIYNNTSIIKNHQNIISRVYGAIPTKILFFVKLKLVLQPNRTINFIKSEVEMSYDEVDEAELNLIKLNNLKQVQMNTPK
jgi:hypothetical protein